VRSSLVDLVFQSILFYMVGSLFLLILRLFVGLVDGSSTSATTWGFYCYSEVLQAIPFLFVIVGALECILPSVCLCFVFCN